MAKNPFYHALRNRVEDDNSRWAAPGFLASLSSLALVLGSLWVGFYLLGYGENVVWWLLGYFAVGQVAISFTNYRMSAKKGGFDFFGHLKQNVAILAWPYFVVRPERDE